MDANIKAEWVAALRSGDYDQTTKTLKRIRYSAIGEIPIGYCCLGVLADIAVNNGVGEWVDSEEQDIQIFVGDFRQNDSTLPLEVIRWCNFEGGADGLIPLPVEERRESSCYLTELNDDDPYMNFDRIADMIDYFM